MLKTGGPVFLTCLLFAGCTSKSSTPPATKKGGDGVPVTVAKVVRKDVPVEIQVIGTVEAYATISVKAQVSGELQKAYVNEGDYVKSGALLFEIDPRPYEAQLNQAAATLARGNALLSQAQANLAREKAQANYAKAQAGRYAALMKEGVISKDQSEQVRSNADAVEQAVTADEAAIESARAEIASAKAAADTIRVQLNYTKIHSPIDGRTGNLTVKQGNIVTANSMELMTINKVQPIYVTFSVPEAQLPAVKKYMAQGKLRVTATPQDDPTAAETGTLTFVDNNVDMTTGTIKLKGTFPNTDRKLWPGQCVRVVLRLTTQPNALVVPNQAVQTGQDGTFVFVMKPDRKVEARPVVTGARLDQDLVIESGLEPNETIVTEGQLRLAPGMRAQVRDASGAPIRRKKGPG